MVEFTHYDARLHSHPGAVGGEFQDAVHVAGEVNLKPSAQSGSGQPGTCASGYEWDAVLRCVCHQPGHIVGIARGHNSNRFDLEDASIGGVEMARDWVEFDIAAQKVAQILLKGVDSGPHVPRPHGGGNEQMLHHTIGLGGIVPSGWRGTWMCRVRQYTGCLAAGHSTTNRPPPYPEGGERC